MKIKTKSGFAAILALVMVFSLSACGEQAQQVEKDGTSVVESMASNTNTEADTNTDRKMAAEKGEKKSIKLPPKKKEVSIGEMYSEEGSASVPDGPEFQYSYHVPQIEDDTPDAAAINEEIASVYGEIAKECLESIHNKEIPYCSNVEYERFCSGDILSLVLKYAYFYDGFEGYATYSYDTAKGVRLANEDILKMQDMTETDYLAVLRRAASKDFDDAYHAAWGNFEDIYSGGYQKLRIQTISERNLSLDMPLYLDDGVLHVIAPIGSIAGPEYLSRDLALEFKEDIDHEETAQLGDYLTVKRRGNTVTIRVRQTPQLEVLLDEYGLINVDPALYDKDLTVNGLYGSYTKILCGEIGETDEPFVFLLTEEGRVDYIDILPCLRGGYFCGSGPLLGVSNVKDLIQSSGDGFPDVCAITKSGERMGLWDTVSFQRYTMGDSLSNTTWDIDRFDGAIETSYSLTLLEGNGENFLLTSYQPETDTTMNFSGNLTYLGMTEKGAVYAYWLWGEFSNGPGMTGVIALNQWFEFDGDKYESMLTVTELGGTPFLGEQTGDTMTLTYGGSYNAFPYNDEVENKK
ncbi:MAG: hypothetical protein ACI4F3_08125 [Enterocloster sp.]